MLVKSNTQWEKITLNCWYGEGERKVEICTGVAVWYHTGLPVVPIRWVLVRDPLGKFESQALLCTQQEYSPSQILEWFVRRWQMEVTFEEARAHKGRGNSTPMVRFGDCSDNTYIVRFIFFGNYPGTPFTSQFLLEN